MFRRVLRMTKTLEADHQITCVEMSHRKDVNTASLNLLAARLIRPSMIIRLMLCLNLTTKYF